MNLNPRDWRDPLIPPPPKLPDVGVPVVMVGGPYNGHRRRVCVPPPDQLAAPSTGTAHAYVPMTVGDAYGNGSYESRMYRHTSLRPTEASALVAAAYNPARDAQLAIAEKFLRMIASSVPTSNREAGTIHLAQAALEQMKTAGIQNGSDDHKTD